MYGFFLSLALTTIEGIIDRAIAGLEQDQPVRKVSCLQRIQVVSGWYLCRYPYLLFLPYGDPELFTTLFCFPAFDPYNNSPVK